MLEKLKVELELENKLTGEFHKFIAQQFKERNDNTSNILERKKALRIFHIYNIPKKCRSSFLKDMESLGLIKLKDKQNIELLG